MNCIDSDFAIDILKGVDDAKDLLDELEYEGDIFITSISVFELTYTTKGISKKKEQALYNLMDTLQVLDLDKMAALEASRIGRKLAKEGLMLHPMDLLIGAVVMRNKMPFVTKNISRVAKWAKT